MRPGRLDAVHFYVVMRTDPWTRLEPLTRRPWRHTALRMQQHQLLACRCLDTQKKPLELADVRIVAESHQQDAVGAPHSGSGP